MNTEITTEVVENPNAIDMGTRGEPTEYHEAYQFDVREEPVLTESGLLIPNMRSIIREDTESVVGTVGTHYKVLSHAAALDPILDRLKSKNVKTFKRVNLVDNGAKMYASVYFPANELTIGNQQDNVWPGITVVNSLDGSLKYLAEATLYRLACTNGMRVPTKMAAFSAMHSKNNNFDAMVDHILDFVADGSQFNTFQKMANAGMKLDNVELRIDKMLADKKFTFPKRYKDRVMSEINKGEFTYNTITAWDIYNAFQSVIEHHLIRDKGKISRGRILEEDLFKYFEKQYV